MVVGQLYLGSNPKEMLCAVEKKKTNNMIRGKVGAMGKEAKAQAKFSWLFHYDMKNVVILIETPPYTSRNHNKDLHIASYLFLTTITIQIIDKKPAHPKT